MGLRGALGVGVDLTNALLLIALETILVPPPLVATSLHFFFFLISVTVVR